jgi:hypothetical protein
MRWSVFQNIIVRENGILADFQLPTESFLKTRLMDTILRSFYLLNCGFTDTLSGYNPAAFSGILQHGFQESSRPFF